ncbi:proline-rich protein 2-like [Budorcas taxicolor]|uniref:proline-rich protein 2-like n=1 Tax=Budorcas taxicolor TaxID=37181 RepID=UPI002283FD8B|nr:proline-rich protein 2-like [Budorcas taxicolor]
MTKHGPLPERRFGVRLFGCRGRGVEEGISPRPSGKPRGLIRGGPRGTGCRARPGPPRPPRERPQSEPASPRPASPPSARRRLLGPPGGARAAGPTRARAPPPARPPALRRPAPLPEAGRRALLGGGESPARAAPGRPEPSRPPRRPRALTSSPGTALAPPLDGGTEAGPRVYPLLPTRNPPRSLSIQPPPPIAIEPRNPDGGSPPAAAGPNAACSPSVKPLARTRRPPLCDRPRLAARRGCSRRKTGLGVPRVIRAHPFPEETPAGRGPRGRAASVGAPSPRSVSPARPARGRPRPAVTRGPPAGPESPLSVQRGDPQPRPPSNLP